MNDELAIIEPQQAPLALFGTNDPVQVIATAARVATALAEVVNERKLFAIVNNKKFPTVEAWTLLGSMLGVFPVTEWSRPLLNEDGSVRGYEARVIARTLSGRTVGAGEAMCVRGESKTWHANAQEFAVRSMAQTRATSKALRGPLDFVFKLAGFQPTPAEEMSDGVQSVVDQDGVIAKPSAASVDALKGAQGGESASPSSGPTPTAVEGDVAAERSVPGRSVGPRAKRSNVVTAPKATPIGQGEARGKEGTPPQAASPAPVAPQSLTEGLDNGKEEYLASLRQQARESAAVLRQLRVRLENRNNKEAIALGSAQAIPLPQATPSTDSDDSLTAYISDAYPDKTLATLNEAELGTMLEKFEELTKRVEARLK
jgi:hypothetical protein